MATGAGYRRWPESKNDVSGNLIAQYGRQRPHTFNGGISSIAGEEKLKTTFGIVDFCIQRTLEE